MGISLGNQLHNLSATKYWSLWQKVGTDISHILYFFVVRRKAVLTHGFVKKTQKTPPEEIDLAKRSRAEYMSRKESDKDE